MSAIKLSSPVAKDHVVALLRAHCPDLDVGRLGAGVSAASSRWVGASIWINKKAITVIPSMPSIPMLLVFLLIVLTGLGLVVFAVAILPRQRALAERVEAMLRRELPAAR